MQDMGWGWQVDYRDGSQEDVWMPVEEVRVCLHALEVLDSPAPETVASWGAALAASAAAQAPTCHHQAGKPPAVRAV